jgi:hypothetical protein
MQKLPAAGSYEQGLHGPLDDLSQLWWTGTSGIWVPFWQVYGSLCQEVLMDERSCSWWLFYLLCFYLKPVSYDQLKIDLPEWIWNSMVGMCWFSVLVLELGIDLSINKSCMSIVLAYWGLIFSANSLNLFNVLGGLLFHDLEPCNIIITDFRLDFCRKSLIPVWLDYFFSILFDLDIVLLNSWNVKTL